MVDQKLSLVMLIPSERYFHWKKSQADHLKVVEEDLDMDKLQVFLSYDQIFCRKYYQGLLEGFFSVVV